MKILVFSDLHLHFWSTYSTPTEIGPSRFADQLNTLKQIINYAKENNITNLIFLGDFFHSRKALETALVYHASEFLNLYLRDFNIIYIAGNHDLTGAGECFSKYITDISPNHVTVEQPSTICLGNSHIALLPWNSKELPSADIALGHIEVKGAWFNKVAQESKGFELEELSGKYKLVLLGHYHMHQKLGNNIIVVGSLNRLTRSDQGLEKGFIVLDLDTLEINFIPVDTFDFPFYIVKKEVKKETKRKVCQIISFEEALKIWLENQKRPELYELAMRYWNEAKN
jgi:DNA repair exonuclease SbcCD nuclease subunit